MPEVVTVCPTCPLAATMTPPDGATISVVTIFIWSVASWAWSRASWAWAALS
jgi:hypothetical protein